MSIRLGCAFVWLASALGCGVAGAATMQAAVVTGSGMHIQSVPRPVARRGQVLVKIHDAGVNPADWKRASGRPEDPAIGKPASGSPALCTSTVFNTGSCTTTLK